MIKKFNMDKRIILKFIMNVKFGLFKMASLCCNLVVGIIFVGLAFLQTCL